MRVLVINLRGLHLGYVGTYGNEWIETPALDRLAAEGIVFDEHHADVPDPAGARRAWRSGLHLFPTSDGPPPPPHADIDVIRVLRRHGVVASLVVDGSRPAPPEFADGWDSVVEVEPGAGDDATAMEDALEAWQATLADLENEEHWLLWLDLATLLPSWDEVPKSFLERYLIDAVEEDEKDEEEDDPEEEPEPVEPLFDPVTGPLDPEDDETFVRLQRTYAAAVTYSTLR